MFPNRCYGVSPNDWHRTRINQTVTQLCDYRSQPVRNVGAREFERFMKPSCVMSETHINPVPLDLSHPCKNLIVNYIPQMFTDKNLFDIFVPYGPIHSVKIMREGSNGYSHGYGFVNFIRTEDALEALKGVHGRKVEVNKYLKVSFARPPSEEIKNTNLYITNLPPTTSLEDLGSIFGRFGPILQKNLLHDKVTGRPRGTAFVRFVFRDDAARAISNLNNFVPPGAWKPINVKVAKDHGRQNAVAHYQKALRARDFITPQYWERKFWMRPGADF